LVQQKFSQIYFTFPKVVGYSSCMPVLCSVQCLWIIKKVINLIDTIGHQFGTKSAVFLRRNISEIIFLKPISVFDLKSEH